MKSASLVELADIAVDLGQRNAKEAALIKTEQDGLISRIKSSAEQRAARLKNLEKTANMKPPQIRDQYSSVVGKNSKMVEYASKYLSVADTLSEKDRADTVASIEKRETELEKITADYVTCLSACPDLPDGGFPMPKINLLDESRRKHGLRGWLAGAALAGLVASGVIGWYASSQRKEEPKAVAVMSRLGEKYGVVFKKTDNENKGIETSDKLKEAAELDRQTRETIAKINTNLADSPSVSKPVTAGNSAQKAPKAVSSDNWAENARSMLKEVGGKTSSLVDAIAPKYLAGHSAPVVELKGVEALLAKEVEPYLDGLVKEKRILEWNKDLGRQYSKNADDTYKLTSLGSYTILVDEITSICIGSGLLQVVENLESHNVKVDKSRPGPRSSPSRFSVRAKDPAKADLLESYLDQLVKGKRISEWAAGVTFFYKENLEQVNADYVAELPGGKLFFIKYEENIENLYLPELPGVGVIAFGSKDSIDSVKGETEGVLAVASCLETFAQDKRIKGWAIGNTKGTVREYVVELPDKSKSKVQLSASQVTPKDAKVVLEQMLGDAFKLGSSEAFASISNEDFFANLGAILKKTEHDRKASVREHLQGCELHKHGKLDEAVIAFKKAIWLDPDDAVTYDALGAVWYKQGKLNEAISVYKKSIALNPKNEVIYHNLGSAFFGLDESADAVFYFKKALELNPKSAVTRTELGRVLYAQGKWDEALSHYREAIQIDPKYANAYFHLGFVLDSLGKLDDSVSAYKKAIELDPKQVAAHFGLSVALDKLGKSDEAVSEYKTSIGLYPDNAAMHAGLGFALDKSGKPDEAVSVYKKAIELNPTNSVYHHHLGSVLDKQGKFEDAVSAYKKAIELDPKNSVYHHNLGFTLDKQDKFDEAIAEYLQSIALKPNGAVTYVNMGATLRKQGKRDEAVRYFNEAVKIDSKHANAYAHLGTVLDDLGRLDEAIAAYTNAIELDPRNEITHYNLAVSLEKQKKTDEARKYYKNSADLGLEIAKKKVAELEAAK